MYTNHQKNQHLFSEKIAVNRALSKSNDIQIESSFSYNPSGHIKAYRGFGYKVFMYILQRCNLPFTQLSNERIAKDLKCCIRTVQRWTARFHKDGTIIKFQKDTFQPNHFKRNFSKKDSISIWFNSLTSQQQLLYNTNGKSLTKFSVLDLQDETVILSYNKFNIKNYIQRKPEPRRKTSHLSLYNYGRENPDFFEKLVKGLRDSQKKKELERVKNIEKAICILRFMVNRDDNVILEDNDMLNERQKKWIKDHTGKIDIQKFMNNPRVRDCLITEPIKKFKETFKLEPKDYLKLIVFRDVVLEYAVKFFPFGKLKNINDPMGYLITMCKRYSVENRLIIDWQAYMILCDLFQISKNNAESAENKIQIGCNGRISDIVCPIPTPKAPSDAEIRAQKTMRLNELQRDIQNYGRIISTNAKDIVFGKAASLELARNRIPSIQKEIEDLTQQLHSLNTSNFDNQAGVA